MAYRTGSLTIFGVVGLILTIIDSVKCTSNFYKCNTLEDCHSTINTKYECLHGKCVKGPIEFDTLEVSGIVALLVLVGLTSTGGVGAGSAYTPVLMIFLRFTISDAIMHGRLLGLTGSLISFLIMGFVRDPKNKNTFQMDFKLATVMAPIELAGSQLGVILARWFPSSFLSVILIAYVSYSIIKTYDRAQEDSQKEISENLLNLKEGLAKPVTDQKEVNQSQDMTIKMESNIDSENTGHQTEDIICKDDNICTTIDQELCINDLGSEESDRYLKPMSHLLYDQLSNFLIILLSLSVISIVALIRGSETSDFVSIIQPCKTGSFLILWGSHFALCGLSVLAYFINKDYFACDIKKSSESKNIVMTKRYLIFAMYFGGILSGFLGVGAGMVLSLFMLTLGMDVYSIAALSNFVVLLSTSSTTIQFVFAGHLRLHNSFILIILALTGSLVGNIIFKLVIPLVKRPSHIVWLSFSVLWIALFSLIYGASNDIIKNKEQVLVFGSFC